MKRAALAALVLAPAFAGTAVPEAALPRTLRDTGHDTAAKASFTPRYPLWTDGAAKRRWISLPAGTSIDESNPDAWDFPRGTRLWKEFAFGRPIETRLIERRPDGTWRYLAYVWNADGTEATLAPEDGVVLAVDGAPGGRYVVPSRQDCVACHEGAPVPVLGYSAVQLHGTVGGKDADTRAALGYLHGNCGHCHNEGSLSGVGLRFAQSAADPEGAAQATHASITPDLARDIVRRLTSTNPYVRMPPIGVQAPDAHGAATVERWLDELGPRLRGGDNNAAFARGDITNPRIRGADIPKEKPQ